MPAVGRLWPSDDDDDDDGHDDDDGDDDDDDHDDDDDQVNNGEQQSIADEIAAVNTSTNFSLFTLLRFGFKSTVGSRSQYHRKTSKNKFKAKVPPIIP